MNNAKRVHAILWIGNVLLIIGIVAFAFQFLIFPELRPPDVDKPISVPPAGTFKDTTDTQALAKLPNPLVPPKGADPGKGPSGPIKLIGTDRIQDDPTMDVAYLTLVARSVNVNAYVGEPIRDESVGQEVADLSGWRLKSVTSKTALFDTPSGPVTLQLEEITASPPPAGGALPGTPFLQGTPWDAGRYQSKKNAQRSNDSQEAWDIDRKEMDWAVANVDSLIQGVTLEPYAGGGLKISSLPEGSYGHERGLRSGDVVRNINGQQIESIGKLTDVIRGMSKTATTLTVQVDRSGRLYTLTYTVPRAPR